MGKVYRGRFWRDGLWLLLLPGVIGAAILLGAGAGVVAAVSLARSGGMSWGTASLLLGFSGVPALAAGLACFYTLWGGLGERLEVVDGALSYRAPLFRRLIRVDDIIFVERWPRPRLRYVSGSKARVVTLPNWGGGRYLDELFTELRAVKSDLVFVDSGGLATWASGEPAAGGEAAAREALLHLKARSLLEVFGRDRRRPDLDRQAD